MHSSDIDMDRISKIFGPTVTREQVSVDYIQVFVDRANSVAKDSNLALLARVNEGIPEPENQ